MQKYTWYVIQRRDSNGDRCAFAYRLRNNNNLVGIATSDDVYSMNACDSKKEAQQIATHWNNCYKNNGTYMYD